MKRFILTWPGTSEKLAQADVDSLADAVKTFQATFAHLEETGRGYDNVGNRVVVVEEFSPAFEK